MSLINLFNYLEEYKRVVHKLRLQTEKKSKLALNSQLLTVQILTNDAQVLILCLSNLILTVLDLGAAP